jgi:hypothetical protein
MEVAPIPPCLVSIRHRVARYSIRPPFPISLVPALEHHVPTNPTLSRSRRHLARHPNTHTHTRPSKPFGRLTLSVPVYFVRAGAVCDTNSGKGKLISPGVVRVHHGASILFDDYAKWLAAGAAVSSVHQQHQLSLTWVKRLANTRVPRSPCG